MVDDDVGDESEDEYHENIARAAARGADDYVHDSPWSCIGAAALICLAIGFVPGRRIVSMHGGT